MNKFIVVAASLLPIITFAQEAESTDSVFMDLDQLELRDGLLYLSGTENLFVGTVVTRYHDGSKAETHSIVEGVSHGVATRWYPNGNKRAETTIVDARRDDAKPSIWWYENGNKEKEEQDGLVVEWYENGQKKSELTVINFQGARLETRWHENGQKSYEMNWDTGQSIRWDQDGNRL